MAADPTIYCKYIPYGKKGEALLYVHVQKGLYSCLNSALIFHKKLVGDLEAHWFDPCVANNTVEVKHLTITCHMDDLKILHVDRKVITDTILWLEFIYGKMQTTYGKWDIYLVMWMDS